MVFFNQGAFGAALREVLREQDAWRTRMERQTGRFFMNDLPGLLAEVTRPVAAFAGSVPERTLMVENASTGLMTAMTALSFRPGDRIVITDHVYGAVRKALQHVCRLTGAEIAEVAVPLPVKGPSDFLQPLAEAIDARTRLVVIDHVTSPSSLVLPVAEIAALCREAGTRLLVDASHAPGLVEVEADSIGADFYVANCHKWLCAPKGAAFMVVGEAAAAELELHPLVISHAYGQGLSAEFAKIGTRDPSAWLSVPAAIDAHERLGGARLRARDAQLARSGGRLVAERLGTEVSGPDEMISGMVSVRLPGAFGEASWPRAGEIRDALWHSARIEALVAPHSGALWLRLCTFAYTEPEEFDLVAAAVSALLRKEARP
ncbi:aminotransferase class V-fold PLP-dependent enzyme [Pseudoroseicyclus tamaricis]|uniref:Aminotransferase class V-fold PLP-dependent enzyme n=1 Tax=Pseudoroseicyclus tamaricis TaxID=2705421 RepID=A0A6B2JH69_9RHOB|nr:aminotransferase class V-fold PLP-dependent enzyme [Pseudoroseicyclus tamaricis]NDV00563.1 aminotransferase class V-fold PLP-dependent enzyme [Pseudoroseicyclus tamaricis]